MAKPRFKWSAGGLDVAAKTLVDLQEKGHTAEIPEDHSARLRQFFEREGYTVRHTLTNAGSEACGEQWVTLQTEAMQKLYKRHRGMVMAAALMMHIARSWPLALSTMEA